MNKNIEIGIRIKQRRTELNMTQEELGRKLGLNKSTIQRYESGSITSIKIPVLQSIAKQLDVNPDWLALKTDEMGSYHHEKSPSEESEGLDNVYFSLAKDAQQNGIDPDDIRLAIETIKSMKNRKAGDQP